MSYIALARKILAEMGAPVPDPVPVEPLDTGHVVAVLLRSEVLDGATVWIVEDDDALAAHPDILRSGFAVFYFDELPRLAGASVAELRQLAQVKRAIPGARLTQ